MACGNGLLIYRNGNYDLLDIPNPCENVFFVIEFDLQEYRDLFLRLGPWFWESSGLWIHFL